MRSNAAGHAITSTAWQAMWDAFKFSHPFERVQIDRKASAASRAPILTANYHGITSFSFLQFLSQRLSPEHDTQIV